MLSCREVNKVNISCPVLDVLPLDTWVDVTEQLFRNNGELNLLQKYVKRM